MFIVMDCYEGETLKSRIANGPRLPDGSYKDGQELRIEEAIRIAIQVADGLSEAHAHEIIHRDIKPANIMVTARGDVKILDFGLAKLAGQTLLTRSGSTVGTAAYMSPEQARGEKVDHRTDIWSLGVVLYEMLSGRRPFEGEFEQAVLYGIVNQEPVPLEKQRNEIPQRLVQIVHRALQKDPSQRYQKAEEMLADLRQLQAPSVSISALKMHLRTKLLRWPVVVSGAIIVLALAFFFGWPLMEDLFAGTERIPVTVMPFENKTGDAQYDDYSRLIPRLLITSLEESSRLRVTTFERLGDLLKQVGKAEIKPDDVNLGFELCRKDSTRALVTGTFLKAGDVFTTEVKVLDVRDGSVVKTASSSGKGTNSLLKSQIDLLSKQIATGIGVPEKVAAKDERPIQDVTTTSWDAYSLYVRGEQEYQRFLRPDAISFLTKAIEIDSTFAMAYYALSRIGTYPKRQEALEKARQLAEKAPRKERLLIQARYAGITGDTTKQRELYQQLETGYPNDKMVLYTLSRYYGFGKPQKHMEFLNRVVTLDPSYGAAWHDLGYEYLFQNEPEKALEALKKNAAATPGSPDGFDSMGDAYFFLGKLDSSILRYKQAFGLRPGYGMGRICIPYISALMEDYDTALKWVNSISKHQAVDTTASNILVRQAAAHGLRSFLYGWIGATHRAHEEMKKALEVAPAWYSIPLEGCFLGLNTSGIDLARASLDRYSELIRQLRVWDSEFDTVWISIINALIGLRTGNLLSAEAHVADARSYKTTGRWREYISPAIDNIEAELLLQEGKVDSAIQHWSKQPALSHRLFIPGSAVALSLWTINNAMPRDGLARAYVKKGDLDAAIKEYERITTLDTLSRDRRLIHPLHRYELAKLYEKKGLKEKAIAQYETFLFLWKNADRDKPEPKDARRRLAALKRKT